MSETELDENGQWTGTCCQCLTSHDGHPPGTLGGEARCLIAQAEELGDPELVNKARDVLRHAAERRDGVLVRAWNLEHPGADPMSDDVDRLAALRQRIIDAPVLTRTNPDDTLEDLMDRVLQLAWPETAARTWFMRWQLLARAARAVVDQYDALAMDGGGEEIEMLREALRVLPPPQPLRRDSGPSRLHGDTA